jgi:hypothetical protein
MWKDRAYVSLRISVLVSSFVIGSTPRLTLNRVISFSSDWICVAVAERSSISFKRVVFSIPWRVRIGMMKGGSLLCPFFLVWDAGSLRR